MKKKCNFLHLFVKIVNVANFSDIDKQTLMVNSEIIVIGIYYCMKNEDIMTFVTCIMVSKNCN